MQRHTLSWTLVFCLTTAVVTSASAARRDSTLMLAVRPSVTTLYKPVTVSVTGIDDWRAETVTLQFQECGLYPVQFRAVAEAVSPSPSGSWFGPIPVPASGTFRLTRGPDVSNEVRVLTRAHVQLQPIRPGRYRTYVEARQSFWRKHVRIERYDRSRSRWVPLRPVMLVDTDAVGTVLIQYVRSSSDEFALKLPRRTKLRAVFPLSQAKPCYAAGSSQVLQT
jgi:hypothetical protein